MTDRFRPPSRLPILAIITAGALVFWKIPASIDARSAPLAGQVQLRLTEQASGTRVLLQAISAVDDQVVWVSGHGGTFLRTTDGGLNWSARVVPGADTLQFRDVDAFDAQTAYLMSAGPGPLSRIYRTDDGGDTWKLQFLNEHPDGFLDCMAFWDSRRGIVYGDAIDGGLFVLRTEDGGASWVRVPEDGLPPAQEGEGGFAASGSCVATGSGGRAWIATGNGVRARVLRTEDEGRTWQVRTRPGGWRTRGRSHNDRRARRRAGYRARWDPRPGHGARRQRDAHFGRGADVDFGGTANYARAGLRVLMGAGCGDAHGLRRRPGRRGLLRGRRLDLARRRASHLLGSFVRIPECGMGRRPRGTDHSHRFPGRLIWKGS